MQVVVREINYIDSSAILRST